MQKLILSCSIAVCSIATAAVTSVEAQSADVFLDSTSPQVIERIDGNIVSFRNVAGESNNYYVPNWMFSKYNLQVGTSANLYNQNIVQGVYRDRYIDSATSSLSNVDAFALNDSRSECILAPRYATEGLSSGKRVWFKTKDCSSTIPIVGAMSFYQPKTIASVVPIGSSASLPSITQTSIPNSVEPTIAAPDEPPSPVRGLW
ncbi:MAG: hypothetical protein WCP16_14430 [Pseudanabaena sp. ELA645]|jgi:hypothetical protein